MGHEWSYTDNQADPCALCVHWESDGDPLDGDDFYPVGPTGEVEPFVCRALHDYCLDSLARHQADVEARRARGES